MTDSTIDSTDLYEAEIRRRLRERRKAKRRAAGAHVEMAILIALAIGFFVFLYFWNKYRPMRERAAYNQGYFRVTRAEAVAMAEAGIGKTAEEVL